MSYESGVDTCASGDPKLAVLVRERQDLVHQWQSSEKEQDAALGQETAKRNFQAEAENSARMKAIDERIAAIDTELGGKYSDYASLANPAPLSAQEVQAQLGADEALVLFLDTPEMHPPPEETFVWVVTKTDLRWVRSDLGGESLTREVAALRAELHAVDRSKRLAR